MCIRDSFNAKSGDAADARRPGSAPRECLALGPQERPIAAPNCGHTGGGTRHDRTSRQKAFRNDSSALGYRLAEKRAVLRRADYLIGRAVGNLNSQLRFKVPARGKLPDPRFGNHRDSFNYVPQVLKGIYAEPAARSCKSEEDRRSVGIFLNSEHKPVLPAQNGDSKGIFAGIVIDLDLSVLQVQGNGLPVSQRVVYGPSEVAFGKWFPAQTFNEVSKLKSNGLRFFRAKLRSGLSVKKLLPCVVLNGVKSADKAQGPIGFVRGLHPGIEKSPPAVGHAPSAEDPRQSINQVKRPSCVRLEDPLPALQEPQSLFLLLGEENFKNNFSVGDCICPEEAALYLPLWTVLYEDRGIVSLKIILAEQKLLQIFIDRLGGDPPFGRASRTLWSGVSRSRFD